ncbi:MAG: indolepyruvate ferredoxin oxidoreductase family protein, partial [Burkholderiaceae bacterium]|nr:indolepyruvate ferredoxin oxidoreductase family protein [Burkholderiaceae bacterium]
QILEYALKEELYNWRDDVRPKIYGKFDEKDGRGGEWAMPQGRWLLPAHAELSPALIAKAIAARLLEPGRYGSRFELAPDVRAGIESRLAILAAKERSLAAPHVVVERTPTFCSGCPHNTSTHVPEGSRALAGIGCHYMTTWMPERRTGTFTQMGGEGVPWIGQAPFTAETHVFANLGDGTYFHSGLLAIRASIAAGVNITYKILYNDAVAMTGGQPIDGTLTVPQVVAQLRAEGARRIVVATDEPQRYDGVRGLPELAGVDVFHRDHLDWLQRELRETPGCTILIYDQTCASEKRRRRKKIVDGRPGFPDPARRVVINEQVCEGCGDCSVQSSCVSIEPLETELGRKRRINQSSCNKDYSCLKGFCPSFVTVVGGRLRRPEPVGGAPDRPGAQAVSSGALSPGALSPGALKSGATADAATPLPDPAPVSIRESGNRTYGILVTGVGGTGVVTIGQLLGMAAHLEGKGVSVLDMAGLAQKGGAVFSHVQIADDPAHLHATRIATGEADLLLGCDLIVSAGNEALSKMRPEVTRAVINDEVLPTSEFLRNADWQLPAQELKRNILEAAGERDILFIDAQSVALALMGDALYGNPLLLGYAWQQGWVPLSRAALRRAIELNGVSVAANLEAFEWGRRYAHDPAAVRRRAGTAPSAPAVQPADPGAEPRAEPGAEPEAGSSTPRHPPAAMATIQVHRRASRAGSGTDALQTLLDDRSRRLRGYQDARWADAYLDFVGRVRDVERSALPGSALRLTDAVARGLFKLMAYKDEYEVARLLTDPAFRTGIARQFEGDWSLRYHLSPPGLARVDPRTGRPRKIEFGPWLAPLLSMLARLRFLRGTPFDPFGHTAERRIERALIPRYRALIETVLSGLTAESLELALEIARLPEDIRGYGPVKQRYLADFERHEAALVARWQAQKRSSACESGSARPAARAAARSTMPG